ncbi:MAG: RIP metalloprotease RseP [Pseudomonadota bacterium]
MGTVLGSAVAFIVAISILVAVHEYGHYIVGRICGMKVLRFSIGFGKPIWTRVAGPDRTEYCISAIPLGGYVRFLDSREADVLPADVGRAFDQRPVPQRIAVLFAGPLFNFLFAILAYWALFVYGIPTVVPAVGDIEPGSYADEAGLEYGDRIVSVNGQTTPDWESTLLGMLDQLVAEGRVDMTLEDDDGATRRTTLSVGEDRARLTEPGMLFDGLGFQAWQFPAVVGSVSDDGTANRAGVEVGDRIVSVDGEPVRNFSDLIALIAPRPGATVELGFIRADTGREESRSLTIDSVERDGQTIGMLGIGSSEAAGDFVYLRKFGPLESVGKAIDRTWASSVFTLKMLGRMLTGDVSIKNISGPINIAQFAGQSAERGVDYFLGFLAIVSISLGVLNLLPVPVLDGGQIVYQTIELLKGSPLSERAQIIGQQAGILALIMLMSFAFYNDIARILG